MPNKRSQAVRAFPSVGATRRPRVSKPHRSASTRHAVAALAGTTVDTPQAKNSSQSQRSRDPDESLALKPKNRDLKTIQLEGLRGHRAL